MVLRGTICEYDIKAAGFSALYDKGYISEKEYKYYLRKSKKDRVVLGGLLIKENPEYGKIQAKAFEEYINRFKKANRLKDHHELEIAKDAIWIIGRKPSKLIFGKIEFVLKREFTSLFKYYNVTFYVNSQNGKMDIRGLNPDLNHKMLRIIKKILINSEYHNDIYVMIHKVKNNLIKNPDYYGPNLIPNKPNLLLIKKLIRDIL